MKREGLPAVILLDALLAGARRPVELVGNVDNTQAITAVSQVFDWFCSRTHRVRTALR